MFTKLLSVELIRKTFVFIGFSFNDPNLERILSIAKQSLSGKSPQTHYCFMRKVQLVDYLNENNKLERKNIEKYIQDRNYQELRIAAMVKYGILTILINDYDEITLMLNHLYNKYITNNVFISGGINPEKLSDYGSFDMNDDGSSNLSPAESFLTTLGKELINNNFHIYTGFGAGVGNYLLAGVLQGNKNGVNGNVINDEIHISSMMEIKNLETKNHIRERMIEQCSSSIIVFGYGEINSGTYQEYDIAKGKGKYIIPVKKTGFAAKKIYDEIVKKNNQELLFLEKENRIARSGIKVFISYHYDSDNEIAKKITDIVNGEKTNLFTVIQEEKKPNSPDIIKKWVDNQICKTKFTILLISKDTFKRQYVSYEIERSKENGNTFIPILIDDENKKFTSQKIERIRRELPEEKCEIIRCWYRDSGEKNILKWLNAALDE